MHSLWLQVLAVMIGGSLLKYLVYYRWAWVGIDLAVLGIAYLLLRRHRFVDFNNSMMFLGGLTAVNVLTDLGIISEFLGNLLILGVLAWMILRNSNGGGGDDWRQKRPLPRHKWHK
jgi:hypothetical protein